MTIPFTLVDSFCMFFIYAFFGWIIEVIYYAIEEGRFINRGFLNGPLCPVYGVGFYAVILLLLPIENNIPILFFGSMAVTTFIELLAGVILYKIFDLRWWDYSNYKLNLKGFICLQFSIYWGIACTLGIKILHPSVMYVLGKVPNIGKIVMLSIFSVLLIIDLITTVVTIIGFKRKLLLLSDVSKEIRHMSDKLGGRIYGGVETVVTKAGPAMETAGAYKEMYQSHRAEELDLLKRHHKEEREFLEEILKKSRDGIRESATRLSDKSLNLAKTGFKKGEEKLLSRIVAGKNDANRMLISILKRDEGEIKDEDNGSI